MATGWRLTPDGRHFWTVSSGRGINDVRIVSVRTGRVVQTLRLPGASGGIAMDRRSRTVYVSGVRDSTRDDQTSPPGTPGIGGDVVHVFTYDRSSGRARRGALLDVPAPPDAEPPPPGPNASGLDEERGEEEEEELEEAREQMVEGLQAGRGAASGRVRHRGVDLSRARGRADLAE